MVDYKDTSNVAKKAAEVAQKKEQQLAHGELYPYWKWDNNLDGAYLQNQKHKIQTNIFKIATHFFNFKLQIIRLEQGHWCCTPTH